MEGVKIRRILEPARYVPRLLGIMPYRFTKDDIVFSRIGYFYALFYASLYGISYYLVANFTVAAPVPISAMRWPQLLTELSCLTSCIVCIVRNGFQQQHVIDFMQFLYAFDAATSYAESKSGKRDSTKLHYLVWTTSCVPILHYALVLLTPLISNEEMYLHSVVTAFYFTPFLAELMMFVKYTLLLGIRLRYINEGIEDASTVKDTGMSSLLKPRDIRIWYITLLKAGDVLNEHYNLQYLIWSFHISVHTICRLLIIFSPRTSVALLMYSLFTLATFLVSAVAFMVAAQYVGDQADETAKILLKQNIELSKELKTGRQEYFQTSLFMSIQPYKFRALGFVDVDMRLCNTIFIAAVMFVPILAKGE